MIRTKEEETACRTSAGTVENMAIGAGRIPRNQDVGRGEDDRATLEKPTTTATGTVESGMAMNMTGYSESRRGPAIPPRIPSHFRRRECYFRMTAQQSEAGVR